MSNYRRMRTVLVLACLLCSAGGSSASSSAFLPHDRRVLLLSPRSVVARHTEAAPAVFSVAFSKTSSDNSTPRKAAASSTEVVRAYALLSLSAVFFGVMYAPARKHRRSDGIIFQFLMSIGVVSAGFLLQLLSLAIYSEEILAAYGYKSSSLPLAQKLSVLFSTQGLFYVTGFGLLGGLFWGLSNVCVLITVKFLGLGVGFTLYHAVNLTLGYLIGRFQWFGVAKEDPKNVWQDLSQLINVVSFVLVMSVEGSAEGEDERKMSVRELSGGGPLRGDVEVDHSVPEGVGGGPRGDHSTAAGASLVDNAQDPLVADTVGERSSSATLIASASVVAGESPEVEQDKHSSAIKGGSSPSTSIIFSAQSRPLLGGENDVFYAGRNDRFVSKKAFGVVIGLIAGCFCALNMVPYMNWCQTDLGKSLPVHLFTLSQTLGIFMVSAARWDHYFSKHDKNSKGCHHCIYCE